MKFLARTFCLFLVVFFCSCTEKALLPLDISPSDSYLYFGEEGGTVELTSDHYDDIRCYAISRALIDSTYNISKRAIGGEFKGLSVVNTGNSIVVSVNPSSSQRAWTIFIEAGNKQIKSYKFIHQNHER